MPCGIRRWRAARVTLKSDVDVADDVAEARLERVLPGWTGDTAPIFVLFPSTKHLPMKTKT